MLAACVTGHRCLPYPGWVMSALEAELERALAEGYGCFYTGMAPGADRMAAKLLLGRARVVAVVPCRGFGRFWPEGERREYEELLRQVDEVVFYPGGHYERWKPLARNRWMVERSKLVIAVHDGRRHGGTWYTVQYARQRGVPVRFVPVRPEGPGRRDHFDLHCGG